MAWRSSSDSRCACVVKRSENGNLGGLWLQSYGLSVRSEVVGRFYRVRRAAPSLQLQSEEPVVARYGLAKTATLTMPMRMRLGRLDLRQRRREDRHELPVHRDLVERVQERRQHALRVLVRVEQLAQLALERRRLGRDEPLDGAAALALARAEVLAHAVDPALVARVQVGVARVVVGDVHPLGVRRVVARRQLHLGAELVVAVKEHRRRLEPRVVGVARVVDVAAVDEASHQRVVGAVLLLAPVLPPARGARGVDGGLLREALL